MDEQQVYIYDVISAVICRTGRPKGVAERGSSGSKAIGEFSIYI